MREILFRGKTLESGRWIYGDLRQWSSGHVGICDRETNRTIKVEAESVGQYIRLKDKAGTHFCPLLGIITDPDFYCKKGERRQGHATD